MKKILLLDNHDSFTYNLAGLLRNHRKVTFNIIRPEDLVVEEVQHFDKILFSPGPGVPDESPSMFRLLELFHRSKPILGICLGHQAIGEYFGGIIKNLGRVIHGQPRQLRIMDPDHYLFQGIKDNTVVGLYHSWVLGKDKFPAELRILALSEEGLVMAIAHKTYDICGLQFHPESIITAQGRTMMDNWIDHS
jgi:anthranilate synthase/aminodeoxychorismate synthase-like glutamine amidotransferase